MAKMRYFGTSGMIFPRLPYFRWNLKAYTTDIPIPNIGNISKIGNAPGNISDIGNDQD
jgi:hypothetical protein